MQWHGREASLPVETLLELAWGLLKGFRVPLESFWAALGWVPGGSWQSLGGFKEASWTTDRDSKLCRTIFEKNRKFWASILGTF